MNHIQFITKVIQFEVKKKCTLENALSECVLMCIKENIEIDLIYNGFTFSIDKDSRSREKLREYTNYLNNKLF